jgi:general stress protein 26
MKAKEAKKDEAAPKIGNVDELHDLVEGIETAMLTTRRADGHLVSRPMATQKRASGADFWFVTADGLPKVDEIAGDPRVNLAYYRDRTREWVSISGEAKVSRDRTKIHELWAPDWKAWFPDEGGKKDGGPDDPRLVLIAVQARSAQYMTLDKPQPVVLFEWVRAMVTGRAASMGEVKRITMRRGGRTPTRASSSNSGRRRRLAGTRRPPSR